jgi:hypothetical protein
VVQQRVAKKHGHGQQRAPRVHQQQPTEHDAGHHQPPKGRVRPIVVVADGAPAAAVLGRQVEVEQVEVGQYAADEGAGGDRPRSLLLGHELGAEVAGRQMRDEHNAPTTAPIPRVIPAPRQRCATA